MAPILSKITQKTERRAILNKSLGFHFLDDNGKYYQFRCKKVNKKGTNLACKYFSRGCPAKITIQHNEISTEPVDASQTQNLALQLN